MVVTSSAQSTHLLLQQVDFLLHYFGRTWGMARILSFFELRQKLQTLRISFHHWFMGNLSMFTTLWSFELPSFNLNIWGFYWLSFRLSLWCRLGFHLCLCCGNSFGLWSLAVGKDWEKQDFRHVFDMLLIINVLSLITIWITQVSCFSFSFPGQYQGAFGFAFGSSRALVMRTTAICEGKQTANIWGPAKFLLSSRPIQECEERNHSWYKSWWILYIFLTLDSLYTMRHQASLGRVPVSRPGIPLSRDIRLTVATFSACL